jgi:hypothetical protein
MDQHKEFGFPDFATHTGNASRDAGLDMLKELRLNGGAPHQDWGSVVLSIPPLDFVVITARYPELASLDHEINHKAWGRFLASSESKPYRVRDTDGVKRHG